MTEKQFLEQQLQENMELIEQNSRYSEEFKAELREENEILIHMIAKL